MFKIKIAFLIIEIHHHYDYVYKLCKDYIVESDTADFLVEVSEEEILKEAGNEYMKGYAESLCIYRKICTKMNDYNAFLMHCASVSLNGEAALFSAPSGTGKTTHLKLWQEVLKDKMTIVNGDKPIIRYLDGAFYVFGTPWMGKENYGTNTSAKIKKVYFIVRDESNYIVKLTSKEAFSKVVHQLLFPEDKTLMAQFLTMLDLFIKNVSWCDLHCNMNLEAAEVAINDFLTVS